ncbi:restriction endonuclease subunit S [Longimicrobium sp.]|uniref:restriction endonuclease subunit S n=1 Tax=Longimicrobium sp. TaxID=2029185 RepID=UPI002B65EBDE|nr:restriction endonuclease subunit S [Longimicrobium sp.]HSU13528.1 restriction endonuclease subunit S [Longimicrobium sp.]
MTADKPSLLVPQRRFPEFAQGPGWDHAKVSDLVETITPPKKLTTSTYLADGRFPIIDQSQSYICGWTNDEEAIITRPLPVIVFGDHTCVLKFVNRPFAQGADGIKILTARRRVSTVYLYHQLTYRPVVMEEYKRHFSALKDKVVCFPDPKSGEQQKIVDCLGSLDALIAAEGRKLKALRQHRHGLMQQLFPQPGETVPRLRLPEFRDATEWETRNLEELVLIQSGGTPSKADPAFWNGSIPWVSAKDMKRLFLEETEDHISVAAVENGARLVPAGTLLLLTRGMTLLKDVPICVIRREMSFNQDVKALRPKIDVNGLFLAFALLGNKQRLLKMVDIAGHGTGKLNTDELATFELAFPEPAEQNRIAAILSSLDEMVTAQSRKVEGLEAQKQGLLQQLFPSLEEESR